MQFLPKAKICQKREFWPKKPVFSQMFGQNIVLRQLILSKIGYFGLKETFLFFWYICPNCRSPSCKIFGSTFRPKPKFCPLRLFSRTSCSCNQGTTQTRCGRGLAWLWEVSEKRGICFRAGGRGSGSQSKAVSQRNERGREMEGEQPNAKTVLSDWVCLIQ